MTSKWFFIQSGTGGQPVISKTNLWGLDVADVSGFGSSSSLQSAGGVSGLLSISSIQNPQTLMRYSIAPKSD